MLRDAKLNPPHQTDATLNPPVSSHASMSSSAISSAAWRSFWPTGLRMSKNSASCLDERGRTCRWVWASRKASERLDAQGLLKTSARTQLVRQFASWYSAWLLAWCSAPLTRRRYWPTLKCLVGWPSL